MQKRGTSWVKKKDIYSAVDDAGYFEHWKPKIEEVAHKMVHDYRLPDSNLDDLISDGILALTRVPKESRWNSKYVWVAIQNRMRDGLQQAKTRWSRFELWAELPDTIPAPDGINNRVALKQIVSTLEGLEANVVNLYLYGYDDREIAFRLGVQLPEVKAAMLTAVSSMRSRINPQEHLNNASIPQRTT
jgi:DNA-directed RNA polymerase specialized sigma24 family protein